MAEYKVRSCNNKVMTFRTSWPDLNVLDSYYEEFRLNIIEENDKIIAYLYNGDYIYGIYEVKNI